MENEKPFACSVADCGMRFTNEDHLTVHKQKHELSLVLTPTATFKTSFFDQTPTPTRFLNALETELFNEFHNENPFDVTFRRANSLVAANCEMPIISETALLSTSLSSSEPLNTPSIILPSEEPTPMLSQTKSIISLKQPTPRTEINSNDDGKSSKDNPPLLTEVLSLKSGVVAGEAGQEDKDAVVSSTSLILDDGKLAQAFEQTVRDTVVQTPVITSVGNLTKGSATCVPTAVVVTRTSTNDISTLSTSVSQIPVMTESSSQSIVTNNAQQIAQPSVLQLVIRLPDGQSMPVSFPIAVAPTVAPTPLSQNSTTRLKPAPNASQIQSTPQSLAKKKLKEVLKSQQRAASSTLVPEGTSTSLLLVNNCSFSQNESESPPSSPISVGRPSSSGRRRRTLDDPDERRKKSLERNRAAATRCRQKRKQWISSLESKATEMAKLNLQLQQEVNMLRNEVAQLKTMLLAHKDCPVTQQQQASGLIEDNCRGSGFKGPYNSIPVYRIHIYMNISGVVTMCYSMWFPNFSSWYKNKKDNINTNITISKYIVVMYSIQYARQML